MRSAATLAIHSSVTSIQVTKIEAFFQSNLNDIRWYILEHKTLFVSIALSGKMLDNRIDAFFVQVRVKASLAPQS